MENGSVVARVSDWEESSAQRGSMREFLGVMELLCVLIVVMVT